MVSNIPARYRTGLWYTYIHFVYEIITFYILSHYVKDEASYFLALMYDFYAFVPQGLVGYMIDEGIRIPLLGLGTLLALTSLEMCALCLPGIPVILVISLGSVLVHVSGAERTLRESPGEMTPSALFVSGGSFGLITGKILAMYAVPVLPLMLIALTILVPMIRLRNPSIPDDHITCYHYASDRYPIAVLIFLAVFVVAVRAYMGYGIPTSWRKTLLQTVLLYIFMGCGKAAGGILIDRIGIRPTIWISTLGAAPFLIAGDRNMYISLVGVMLFSMTMAVTLAILVSVLPQYPGIAFGFTTLGLFLGTFPVFFVRLPSGIVNSFLVVGMALLCAVILRSVTRIVTPPESVKSPLPIEERDISSELSGKE